MRECGNCHAEIGEGAESWDVLYTAPDGGYITVGRACCPECARYVASKLRDKARA